MEINFSSTGIVDVQTQTSAICADGIEFFCRGLKSKRYLPGWYEISDKAGEIVTLTEKIKRSLKVTDGDRCLGFFKPNWIGYAGEFTINDDSIKIRKKFLSPISELYFSDWFDFRLGLPGGKMDFKGGNLLLSLVFAFHCIHQQKQS